MYDDVTPVDLHGRPEQYPGGSESPYDGLVDGHVVFVDTKKHVFRFLSVDGSMVLTEVLYGNMLPGGHGEVDIPTPGELVTVQLKNSGKPILKCRVMGSCATSQGTLGTPLEKQTFLSDSVPGDFAKRVFGGAFIKLLRGGLAKIGVTPVCQIVFVKARNLVRLIAHTMEIITSGMRFYTSNEEGDITTRVNLFTRDYKGKTFSEDFSKRSDIDVMVDNNGLSVLICDVDKEGESRKVKTTFQFSLDGSVNMSMGEDMSPDGKSGKRQELSWGFDYFSHKIFSLDGKKTLYAKTIRSGKVSSVSEQISGNYTLQVDGMLRMNGVQGASYDGKTIQIGNDESIVVETRGNLSNTKSSLRS